MAQALIHFLQILQEIPEADQATIAVAFTQRRYKEGEPLLEANHVCNELFFITEGVLKIVGENEHGETVTHYFLRENQFCTILKSFSNREPASNSIQAACPAEVLVITRSGLMALYEKVPYLKDLIDGVIQQGLLDKLETRNLYRGYDASTRYQLFVLRQPEIATRVSLSSIASYLGITLQSLSRIRKGLSKPKS